MLDFEIDVFDMKIDTTKSVRLPLNYVQIGVLEEDDIKLYIKQSVYKTLEEYASSDTSHELGSVLLGEYSDESGKINVIISDYIYAKYTDSSASSLTFTHKTWEYIYGEQEANNPDKKIIGWQHTHPGFGIFLSSYDMFIQEYYFNLEFQVAYVIDPIQHHRGFFQWKNGKVERLKGYFIYDDLGIKIDNTEFRENIMKQD